MPTQQHAHPAPAWQPTPHQRADLHRLARRVVDAMHRSVGARQEQAHAAAGIHGRVIDARHVQSDAYHLAGPHAFTGSSDLAITTGGTGGGVCTVKQGGPVVSVDLAAALAPTGQDAHFTLYLNGVSLGTVALPAGARQASLDPSSLSWASLGRSGPFVQAGDVYQIDVAQAGSGIPGQGVEVSLTHRLQPITEGA